MMRSNRKTNRRRPKQPKPGAPRREITTAANWRNLWTPFSLEYCILAIRPLPPWPMGLWETLDPHELKQRIASLAKVGAPDAAREWRERLKYLEAILSGESNAKTGIYAWGLYWHVQRVRESVRLLRKQDGEVFNKWQLLAKETERPMVDWALALEAADLEDLRLDSLVVDKWWNVAKKFLVRA